MQLRKHQRGVWRRSCAPGLTLRGAGPMPSNTTWRFVNRIAGHAKHSAKEVEPMPVLADAPDRFTGSGLFCSGPEPER